MTLDISNSVKLELIFHKDAIKTYKKIVPVKAIQIQEFFSVSTPEYTMHGDAGDYLCQGIEGEKWPVKKAIFEKTYEEIK